jgi:hypothetical protein
VEIDPEAEQQPYDARGVRSPMNASIAVHAAPWANGPRRSVQLSPSSWRSDARRFAAPRRLREGDRVAFVRQHRAERQPRVENGSCGEITGMDEESALTMTLDGSGRKVTLAGEDREALRLGYAQHIYRQQGATVERAVVLTGGWQTSKESSYVQASRARKGTKWHLAREELGTEGTDLEQIERLAGKMRSSRVQTPSVEYEQLQDPGEQLDPALHLRDLGIDTVQSEIETGQHIEHDHELGWTK